MRIFASMRVKTMMLRDAALLAAVRSLVVDSRRMVLIGLLEGKGLKAVARSIGIGDPTAKMIGRELAADGLTRVAQRGKIVLTASGKRAALAALQPLKSAVLAGASQDNDDLF
jgi:hypothetical protein